MGITVVNNIDQGTDEWLELRHGKVTASRVGAILGHSPFQTREACLREMVREAHGLRGMTDNPAMAWGREWEDTARMVYEAGIEAEVTQVAFIYEDWMGVSPDSLVGDEGMLEIKCPWRFRDDPSPDFLSIADSELRHYYDQVQWQMYVAGRKWCDFFQWAPHGTRCEHVEADPNWVEMNLPKLTDFHGEYLKAMKQPDDYLIDNEERTDLIWLEAAGEFLAAKAEEDAAKQRVKDAQERLKEISGEENNYGGGVYVRHSIRKGSVEWQKLVKEHCPDVDTEDYRKASISIVTVGVK